MNNIRNDKQIKRYRSKYKYLKKRLKSFILENAALCDEVARIQESIVIVKEERKFFLRKLLEYEKDTEVAQPYYKNEMLSNGGKQKMKKRRSLDDSVKTN